MTTETILKNAFDLLIVFAIIGIISSFVYGSLSETNTSQSIEINELGLIIDFISIDPSFKGEYVLQQKKIIESKNNQLTLKSKEAGLPQKYNLISNQKEFSVETDKFEIK